MATVKQLEDHIYQSEDANLQFVDLSLKGGLKEMIRDNQKTGKKST